MHPNPAFRKASRAENLGFARTRGFGVLAVNGAAGPLLSHVPFVLDRAGDVARLHLMRSNPITAALTADLPAVLAVSGPDGYISPDWYGAEDQVPTWNYVAVHLRGTLCRLPEPELPGVLDALSAMFEARLAPKRPWTMAKMSEGVASRMMRAIVPVDLRIDTVDGTWKLGQNKPEAARLGAAEAVAGGVGQELAQLSALMRASSGGR